MLLAHNIKAYLAKSDKSGPTPMPQTVEGYFLISGTNINQVKEDTELHWHVSAEEFVDIMKQSWEYDYDD